MRRPTSRASTAWPAQADQVIENLEKRAAMGIVAPKFAFPLVLDACRKVLEGRPFTETGDDSTLLADFTKKVTALERCRSGDARSLDRARRRRRCSSSFQPAYQKLIAYLETQEKTATDDVGAWRFPDGRDFYEYALRRTTTTNMTADEIHELGLKEVARIHGEMKKIMQQVKFKGDLQAMFKFMREDKQFYLPDTEEGKAEYLARATKIIDTMRGRLDELFLTKPKADVVVKAVEKFREKSAGKAFYQQPAPDGSRPGHVLREPGRHENDADLRAGRPRLSRRHSRPSHADRDRAGIAGHSEIPPARFALHRFHAKAGGFTPSCSRKRWGSIRIRIPISAGSRSNFGARRGSWWTPACITNAGPASRRSIT